MLNAQCSMLNECSSSQCINALNHCFIAYSLKIACPVLNPEWSSLQSDYETSRFSAGKTCQLNIALDGREAA